MRQMLREGTGPRPDMHARVCWKHRHAQTSACPRRLLGARRGWGSTSHVWKVRFACLNLMGELGRFPLHRGFRFVFRLGSSANRRALTAAWPCPCKLAASAMDCCGLSLRALCRCCSSLARSRRSCASCDVTLANYTFFLSGSETRLGRTFFCRWRSGLQPFPTPTTPGCTGPS